MRNCSARLHRHHVHGGAGVDVMDDAPDALDKLAMHKAREGVGSWLPTTVTAPLNTIHAALKRIALRCQRGGLVRKCWELSRRTVLHAAE